MQSASTHHFMYQCDSPILCTYMLKTSLTEEQLKSQEMNEMPKDGGRGRECECARETQPVCAPLERMQNVPVL